MRRPTTVELMLSTTILLWALNLSATKYILEHGFQPLSYATVRYGLAGAVFVSLALATEGSLRIERRHVGTLLVAAVILWLNQLAFVLALDVSAASTVGLLLGVMPIFAGLFGMVLGREKLTSRFWVAAAVSAAGVALVAVGSGHRVSGGLEGILLGLAVPATWAAYSVAVSTLMTTYSAIRVSAVVVPISWVLIALTGIPQTSTQDWQVGWEVWALLAFATLGPLVLTNVLWFRSLGRIGPAPATHAVNLQPFVAALLAVILLSEPLGALQILGGALIAGAILGARRRAAPAQAGID
jgi:drug/metabolite transporter (DMT)-like permease